MRLLDLLDAAKCQPTRKSVDLSLILQFIDADSQLKPLISTTGTARSIREATMGPPVQLPPAATGFLSDTLQIDTTLVDSLWVATSQFIWAERSSTGNILEAFISHGPAHNLGAMELLPPTRHCLRAECEANHLVEPRRYQANLFTIDRGVFPVWTNPLYCRSEHQFIIPSHRASQTPQSATRGTIITTPFITKQILESTMAEGPMMTTG